jgi:hypothetical protein
MNSRGFFLFPFFFCFLFGDVKTEKRVVGFDDSASFYDSYNRGKIVRKFNPRSK